MGTEAKGWYLIVDVAKCDGCNNCTLAVRDEYIGNDFPGYSAAQPKHGHQWIRIQRRVRGDVPMVDAAYLPRTCNHCDAAPCIAAGGPGVVRKRDDGIVIIDPERAKGRRDLVASCPYGAIWWNEERQLPQHWTFDAHLLDQGATVPRCAGVCPTGAIRAVKVTPTEIGNVVEREQLRVLEPALGTHPRVYYRNLHRFDRAFVGGTVLGDVSGVVECIGGAQVSLCKDKRTVAEAKTDFFGEFKFDGVPADGGAYSVWITHPDFGETRAYVTLSDSVYLGRLMLRAGGASAGV